MLKLTLIALLVAGAYATTPALAAPSDTGTIGAGCTLDPFNHTMRCIDWEHCTKNKNGQTVCPVTTTTTRKLD